MSNMEPKTIQTGVFRLVSGSVSEAQTKDAKGNPMTIKSGPNMGQPTQRFSFGIAVPKVPGKHWSDSGIEWLSEIWNVGHAQMGQAAQRKDFSWKVQDGDSTDLNKNNRRPCDNEGWPGHWVVFFSSSYAPQYCDTELRPIDAATIKKGHYVRVSGNVVGNGDTGNPGVYVNHNFVMHAGVGPEIKSGIDAKTAFSAPTALPAGAAPVPVTPAQSAFPAAPPAPAPAAPLPPPQTAVQPSPSFIAPPAAPAAPPPPPAAPARVWKGPAGSSYEAYKAAGWSDEQMRAAGFLS